MKKNIFLIMFDTLSYKWLKAAMNGACEMPNFRHLISNGVEFERAYTSNPVCCPARATIATGLTSRGHGVLENGYYLDPEIPTFMQQLQKVGYNTGLIGKLHAYPHFAGFQRDDRVYGFDEVHVTEDGRGGEWLDWIIDEHSEYLDDVLATIWSPNIPEFKNYGKKHINLYERIMKAKQKYEWSSNPLTDPTHEAYVLPFPKELSQTSWITNKALKFINDAPADKPLFAQISYVQPHGPFGVPREYLDKVDLTKIPEELFPSWESDTNYPKCFYNRSVTSDNDIRYRHCYFADLCYLDEQIGILLDCIEKSGRMKDSYIVCLSDHGDLLGDHGFFGKEERHYDSCIHVPMIICGPDVPKNEKRSCLTQLEDICPTILDMAKTRMPVVPKLGDFLQMKAEDIPVLNGYSLFKAIEDKDSWPRKAAYVESYNPVWSMDTRDWGRTVITDRYRYSWYPEGGEQLFDFYEDPDEMHDLSSDIAYNQIKMQLKDVLLEKIVMQDFPKPTRNLYAFGVH